jgi:multidrug transporter EmrE-like cation transporter
MNKYIFFFLISVFIASISQILLKISANRTYTNRVNMILNPNIGIAYGLFILSMIITTLALRGIEFKLAPIIESIGYVYILILSRILLKEKITSTKLFGNIIIIIGIIVFNL